MQPYVNIYLRHQEVGELQELYRCNTAVELSGFMDQWRKNEAVMAELPSNVKNGCLLFFKYDLLGQRIKTTPTLTI